MFCICLLNQHLDFSFKSKLKTKEHGNKGIAVSNQFANAKVNENIANNIVIGVKSLFSSLFFEVTFPKVFNKNNPVMSHKE